ncbi:MAG: prolyl oligopeptidase family serine peptidase [Gemmatimonadaceae bacterium]
MYFGTRIADPYRWLEDPASPETQAWVAAENALTASYLAKIPERARIRERLTALWSYRRDEPPIVADDKLFYFENSGLQNQPVLYIKNSERDSARVLIDPNDLDDDGKVAITTVVPSHDAHLVVYGVGFAGSDWRELRVRNVRTGRDLADTLKWVKFSQPSWTQDNHGFFYSRYDEPKEGTALTGANRGQKLYYHRIGRPQRDDAVAYERPDHPDWIYEPRVTDDGQYVVITIRQGTDERTRIYYKDLDDPDSPVVDAPAIKLLDEFDAAYHFVDNLRQTFLVETNQDAARGRVIAVNSERSRESEWRTVVAETADPIQSVSLIGGSLVVTYLSNARSLVRLYALNGESRGELPLPKLGTVGRITGKRLDRAFYFAFASHLAPTSIFRYDVATHALTLWQAPTLAFDVTAYETRQLFAKSKDGTQIPFFVTARKGLVLDGTAPTLLSAYGGFNVAKTPTFSPTRLAWLERGGVFVEASLRGGSEYGREWHEGGMRAKKQNVFDDFFAVAEYLIRERYTRPAKLAIEGRSNGGLLVGAAMTQRPELFGAALPAVGVMDMLRYHRFTIGWAWTAEYGSPEDSLAFPALAAYSPLHHIRKGVRYPATLVTTADHDDRVVPGHSYKFAAALQAAQAVDGPPVLIRIDTRTGHGHATPIATRLEQDADELAFLIRNLGMAGEGGAGGRGGT